jgi:hypothetical protein
VARGIDTRSPANYAVGQKRIVASASNGEHRLTQTSSRAFYICWIGLGFVCQADGSNTYQRMTGLYVTIFL